MKNFFCILLVCISANAFAQTPNLQWGKKVWATNNFQLRNITVNNISTDSSNARADDKLITEKAAKDYADKRKTRVGYLLNLDTGANILPKIYVDSTKLDSIIRSLAGDGGGGATTLQQAFDNTVAASQNGIVTGTNTNRLFTVASSNGSNPSYLTYGNLASNSYGLSLIDSTGGSLIFDGNGLLVTNTNVHLDGSLGIGTNPNDSAKLKVAGGIITDSLRIGNDWFFTKTITVPSADILNIATTPVELIPAPGEGKYIEIITVNEKLNFNSTPYSLSSSFFISYVFGEQGWYDEVTMAGSSTIMISYVKTTAIRIAENTSIILWSNDPPTDGDSNITFNIHYKISSF